jgi:endothelin-converting enzyme/putative endopeptidase
MARLAEGKPVADTAEQKSESSLTPEQQFFLGFAQNYCSNARPEFLRMIAQTDPHSPDPLRVRGVIVNMPEFGRAFGCKAGQPMTPVKSCRVW